MFTALFASVFEFLLFLGGLVLIYQIFLSDWIDIKKQSNKEKLAKISSAEKIAQIKLVSNDAKDIEKFATDNADYLSSQMIGLLSARIENLHIDNFLAADDVLKKRIDDLPQFEEEEEENHATTVKS